MRYTIITPVNPTQFFEYVLLNLMDYIMWRPNRNIWFTEPFMGIHAVHSQFRYMWE